MRISIEIVSRGEPTLPAAVKSIVEDAPADTEIVIVDTTGTPLSFKDSESLSIRLLRVPPETRLLEARSIAHDHSTGELSLLLDSTRRVSGGTLESILMTMRNLDMGILPEVGIGDGFWSRLGALDKATLNRDEDIERSIARRSPYILPRCFRASLLTKAFDAVRQNLGPAAFREVTYGDHLLIYLEGLKWTSRCGIIPNAKVLHAEDDSLLGIVRKYAVYGGQQRVLRAARKAYPEAVALRTHRRFYTDISSVDRALLTLLLVVRTASFATGYLFA